MKRAVKGLGEISPVHQDTLHCQKKKFTLVVVCLYMSYLFGSHCKLYTPLTCFLSVMFVPSAHCVIMIWYIIGVEARGFMFGPSIALAIGAKFVPLRKPKKLPGII